MPYAKQSPLISALALAAIGLMVASWFFPLWWVSLTAPNYPPDAFPDGIRIHFSFKGVSNGCTSMPKASHHAQEILQEDLGWRSDEDDPGASKKATRESALDCMHEMNTINHYVGMHPIGFGAPVERLLSKYILGMFAVMLLGFALAAPKPRLVVMGVGFAAVSAWMLVDLFGRGHLDAAVATFMTESGLYFREAERIAGWGATVRTVTTWVAFGLVAVMAAVAYSAWRWRWVQLFLALVPAMLPFFFLTAFGAWLRFFGHNMHEWGAFTLKPFMPTVFGDGLVAQFTTHSYPHVGFALLVAMSLALQVAAVRRRLELLDPTPRAPDVPAAAPAAAATEQKA